MGAAVGAEVGAVVGTLAGAFVDTVAVVPPLCTAAKTTPPPQTTIRTTTTIAMIMVLDVRCAGGVPIGGAGRYGLAPGTYPGGRKLAGACGATSGSPGDGGAAGTAETNGGGATGAGRGAPAGGGMAAGTEAGTVASGEPQLMQNALPAGLSVPHRAQMSAIYAPSDVEDGNGAGVCAAPVSRRGEALIALPQLGQKPAAITWWWQCAQTTARYPRSRPSSSNA